MACPRCLFENPPEARWCGYCGADLHAPGPDPGEASKVRRRAAPDEDPFRPAALRGGAAARTVAPRPPPPPPVTSASVREAPHPPSSASLPPQDRRRTLVEEDPSEKLGEIAGTILLLAENLPPRAFVVRQGRTRLGRGAQNDIVIEDPRISSDHAILRLEPGQAWWLDTSTNGSVVGGRKVLADRADLRDGTIVELGRTSLVIQLLDEETLAALRGSGA